MREALRRLLPTMLPKSVGFDVIDLGSKSQFLKNVPARLEGYRYWLPADRRVVLLLDADQDDCGMLRRTLDEFASQAELTAASVSGQRDGQVLARIVVEMLEAWFFGDPAAVAAAYGKEFETMGNKRNLRIPDEIRDPSRRLGELLRQVPKHRGGLKKAELARDVAEHMNVDVNTSTSFIRFRDGVRFLVSTP